MSAPALAILLFFFAHILAAYGGYVGVLRPGADPSLLPAEAIQFSIPSRSGQPLNGFILESDTYDSGVDLTKLAHVEADREVRLNSPIASRTLWERQAPINSTSWALDRLDGTMDGLFVYPPSAGNKVTVYVLDSGVNVSLPEFGGRVEEGPNFTNETTPGAEDEGHGTFVAALVGGKTYGVAKEVKMVSVKVIESAGVGRVSDIVRGLIHVVRIFLFLHKLFVFVTQLSLAGKRHK